MGVISTAPSPFVLLSPQNRPQPLGNARERPRMRSPAPRSRVNWTQWTVFAGHIGTHYWGICYIIAPGQKTHGRLPRYSGHETAATHCRPTTYSIGSTKRRPRRIPPS